MLELVHINEDKNILLKEECLFVFIFFIFKNEHSHKKYRYEHRKNIEKQKKFK